MSSKLTYADKYSAVNNKEFDDFQLHYDENLRRLIDCLEAAYNYNKSRGVYTPQLGSCLYYADELKQLGEWFKNSRIEDYEF